MKNVNTFRYIFNIFIYGHYYKNNMKENRIENIEKINKWFGINVT